MLERIGIVAALVLGGAPQLASAQELSAGGTRLDIVAAGEVTRVPDIARVSAGVVTQAATASAAIQQNAGRMTSVRAALRRAGIADRDIQTSSISLQPEYRYTEGRTPELTGYRASNEVSVRFGTSQIPGGSLMPWSRRGPTRSMGRP
jgi:uncharacterized protein YggE